MILAIQEPRRFSVIRSSEQRGPMRRVSYVSDTYPGDVVDVVFLKLECSHCETVYVTKGHKINPHWIECETCGENGEK